MDTKPYPQTCPALSCVLTCFGDPIFFILWRGPPFGEIQDELGVFRAAGFALHTLCAQPSGRRSLSLWLLDAFRLFCHFENFEDLAFQTAEKGNFWVNDADLCSGMESNVFLYKTGAVCEVPSSLRCVDESFLWTRVHWTFRDRCGAPFVTS